jgi:hypothetical protein
VRKRSSTAVAVSEGEKAGGGSGEGLVVLVGVEEVGDVGLGGVLRFMKRGGGESKKVRTGKNEEMREEGEGKGTNGIVRAEVHHDLRLVLSLPAEGSERELVELVCYSFVSFLSLGGE